jgi:histidine triad (HIT) family protein
MPLSEEQIKSIKNQLLVQIEKGFPEDKKEYAKKQIQEMNSNELEDFLKSNNLIASEEGQRRCVFCAIVEEKIPFYKIAENSQSIAVLDIRPASPGHTIVMPKQHIESKEKIPKETNDLVKEVSERLKSELKTEKLKIENSNFFGHEIINIVPIYEGETIKPLDIQREEANESELAEFQKRLQVKPKPKVVKKQPETKKSEINENLRLPRRIP